MREAKRLEKCTCPTCGHSHDRMKKATTDEQQERVAREGLKGAREAAEALRDDVEHEAAERGNRVRKAEGGKRKIDAKYQNPDGTFKGGFKGAVAYFQSKGYSKESATKIAGKIAAEKHAALQAEEARKGLEAEPSEVYALTAELRSVATAEPLWPLTKALQPDPDLIRGAWAAVHTVRAQSLLTDQEAAAAEARIAHFAQHHGVPLLRSA